MTTRELRELLLKLDPAGELEVIETRFSDYGEMAEDAWDIVRGVKKSSACYVMKAHSSMSPEEMRAAKDFVHFNGN